MKGGYAIKAALGFLALGSVCATPALHAAPFNLGGSISYNDRVTTYKGGGENRSRYLQGEISADSYVWQPWFLLWNARLSINDTTSKSGGAKTDSVITTGELGMGLFPRSRFPFGVTYTVSDSTVDSGATAFSPFGVETQSSSESLRANQSYTTFGGTYFNLWYNTATWETEGQADQATDALGLLVARRFANQSLQLNASKYEASGSVSDTSTALYSVNHNFTPGSEFTVDTNVQSEDTQSGSNDTDRFNAASNFFWRPEYSDFSVSGGVRLEETGSGVGETRNGNGFLGLNYRISKAVRLNASLTAGLSEAGDTRIGTSTQNVNLIYTSDTYYLNTLQWRWNTSGGLSNSMVRGGGQDNDAQTAQVGLGHDLSRPWNLSKTARLTASAGQNFSVSKSNTGSVIKFLSHNARLSYSQSERSATTSSWLSVTDSRSLDEPKTAMQQMQAQFSRTQNVTRVSSFSGDLSWSWSRQDDGTGDTDRSDGGGGSVSYNNSRVFGVYRLTFNSLLALQETSAFEGAARVATRWENRLNYNIGLLTFGALLNYQRQSAENTSLTRQLQVTRRF